MARGSPALEGKKREKKKNKKGDSPDAAAERFDFLLEIQKDPIWRPFRLLPDVLARSTRLNVV